MKLERENFVLKKHVVPNKKDKIPIGPLNYSASILKLHSNKSHNIVQKFKRKLTRFQKKHLHLSENELGAGAYGSIRSGYLTEMRQRVAVKILSAKVSPADVLAEAL